MRIKIQTRYESVSAMAHELSRVSGRPYDFILRSEAGSCIKIAALKGSIASVADIVRDVKSRAGHRIESELGDLVTVNSRKAVDRVWFSPGSTHERGPGGNFYMVFDAGPARGHHLPDDKWALYIQTSSARKQWIASRTKEILGRRGLERLSWLQMGDAIGVDLDIVSPVGSLRSDLARQAMVDGKTYNHGFVVFNESKSDYGFTVFNDSTIAIKRFGQNRIDVAVRQRLRGFEIACEKGLLLDMQRRSARWPGIFVSPS